MDVMNDRWGFLHPWMEPLHHQLYLTTRSLDPLPFTTSLELSYFDVAIGVKFPWDSAVREMREALVLLAMVASVDPKGVKYVLTQYCKIAAHGRAESMEDSRFVPLRFCLEIGYRKWCLPFLSGHDDTPSESFVDVARKIAAFNQDQSLPLPQLDIPIFFYASEATTKDVDDITRALQNELMTSQDRRVLRIAVSRESDDMSVIPCAFCLGPAQLDFINFDMMAENAELIGEIIGGELPLLVSDLILPVQMWNQGDEPRAAIMGEVYQRVMCLHGRTNKRPMINRFIPTLAEDSLSLLGRLATILPETDAFSSVMVTTWSLGQNTSKIWEYIAYSFFTDQASSYSTISALDISGRRLDTQSAEAFAAVIASPNPARHVFGRRDVVSVENDLAPDDRTRMRLMNGTYITIEPIAPGGNSQLWVLETDVDGVRILDDTDVARVLVPGFGVCTVDWSQLLPPDDDLPPLISPLSTAGITSLNLGDIDLLDGYQPLYRVLELVGANLTRLALLARSDWPIGLSPRRLLQYCPNLRVLVIEDTVIDTTEFLAVVCESNSHISELSCEFDDMPRLLEELLDRTSVLTQHLKRLSYNAFQGIQRERAVWDSFLKILDVNKTLEFVEVKVRGEMYKEYKPRFERHHLTSIPVESEPYPLRSRLAFLSVLRSALLPSLSLDQDVASLIFTFAAERVYRNVYYC